MTAAPLFVHLHLHSEFSLADGLIRIKPLMHAAAEMHMPAVALTDLNNLFAMVKFYKAALAAGIKPLVGMEIQVNTGVLDESVPVVLLAMNTDGYRNLSQLSTRAYRQGQRQGRVEIEERWLWAASEGLIALSGGAQGEVGQLLLGGKQGQLRDRLALWNTHFPGRFYLELHRTGRPGEEAYVRDAVALASEHDLPLVATNDVRFLKRSDFEAHEARVCIQQGFTLDDPRRPRRYSPEQFLRSEQEMADLFHDLPEALANTVEIAKRCNLSLTLDQYFLPEFPIPPGLTLDEYFEQQSEAGLERRLSKLLEQGTVDDQALRARYTERLRLELDVISQMGFSGYFLIVADFIQWAKDRSIPVGPGRGSGAGSLVAYSLQITDIDPIVYDLLFERFLNPERVSMPDFDVDFCMEGRDQVIDYVAQKYGRDKVSQISTHGTMAAKAVVRDVGRIMNHPYGFVDRIAKLIPFEIGITLDKALEQEADLRGLYESDDEVRAIIDMGRSLEGLARNVGKHAGGVVIAPRALTEFTPLYCEEGSDAPVSQLDKDDVEAVGLVKFDFLGLRTLTIIDWAVHTINQARDEATGSALDITAIPLIDPGTFDLLKAQETTGVFQLESRGMKDLIKRLQPDCFEDIVALVALFRPGPLQSGMVDDFINRKHGRAKVEYPHPELEPILSPTYGIILYQEQVMQIAQVLAGYTLGGADMLRRAMGKKKPEEMAKQRSVFTQGAVARGVDEATATYIFDLMEKFAGYGFNKSHSAAYALVSYQTAWLKRHHAEAFMAAVLSSDMDNTDKVVVFIGECRSMGLEVVPPSVNRSQRRFTVGAERTVLYGLGAVKGVGEAAIDNLIDERQREGAFQDLFDLCRRVDLKKLNRRMLEALIRAGALDCIGASRAGLIQALPEAIQMAEQASRNTDAGQTDLFGLDSTAPAPLDLMPVLEWDEATRLAEEKRTLGLYLTGHPINRFLSELAHFTNGRLRDVQAEGEGQLQPAAGGRRRREKSMVVAGLVVETRVRSGQRGKMAIVTLDDCSARIDARLFSEAYEKYRDRLQEDALLVFDGTLVFDDFSETVRLNVQRVLTLDEARELFSRRLRLQLHQDDHHGNVPTRLSEALRAHGEGSCPVSIDYTGCGASARLTLGADWRVRPTDGLLQHLREIVGSERVQVDYR
jgi:DNA polymerase-3 subunit alpha